MSIRADKQYINACVAKNATDERITHLQGMLRRELAARSTAVKPGLVAKTCFSCCTGICIVWTTGQYTFLDYTDEDDCLGVERQTLPFQIALDIDLIREKLTTSYVDEYLALTADSEAIRKRQQEEREMRKMIKRLGVDNVLEMIERLR